MEKGISPFNDKSRAKEAPLTYNGQFQQGKAGGLQCTLFYTAIFYRSASARSISMYIPNY